MNSKSAQRRFVFGCLAPDTGLVALFIFIPTVNVFRMSLFRMGGFTKKQTFVGFENLKNLKGDKNFLQAMQNSNVMSVMVTRCTIVHAVLFATLLQRGHAKGNKFLKVVFYTPTILCIVVMAGIFGAIYKPSTGLLNTFFRAIGLGGLARQWMAESHIVTYSGIFALVWQAIGYYMVMYMSSKATIPPDYYEAA